jgi:hypothetical protein
MDEHDAISLVSATFHAQPFLRVMTPHTRAVTGQRMVTNGQEWWRKSEKLLTTVHAGSIGGNQKW